MVTFSITVKRHIAGDGVDELGNLVEVVSEFESDGWVFAPGSPSEMPERTDVSGALYGPLGADIQSDDIVSFGGVSYSVIGEPEQWSQIFKLVPVNGCRVLVKRRG